MYLSKGYSVVIIVSFILTLSNVCLSQTINIRGNIVDKNDAPLSFAHLHFESTYIGTVSNENGDFEIACTLETSKKPLVISLMGYETKKKILSKGFNKIILNEDITQLQTVTLFSRNYARELIENAIKAIPNNYSNKKERHRGFFREITSWDQDTEKPIYIAEAVLESIKKPYDKKQRSGDVKLIELRKYEGNLLDSLRTRIRAGTHHLHRFDMVQRREGVLANPARYTYKIKDTLQQHGKDIYKIYFEKKDKLSGNLFIMDSTFVIVKAEYNYHSFSEIPALFDISDHNRQFLHFTTTYELSDDQLWRFKSSRYETAFKIKDKQLNLTSTYITTSIKTDSTEIPYLDRIQFNDIVLNEQKEYHPDFWNSYTISLPNKNYEKLFKSVGHFEKEIENEMETKSLATNKLFKILQRLSWEVGFTYTPIESKPYHINFANQGLIVQVSSMANSLKNTLVLTSTLLYKLSDNFHIGYASESKIFRTGITAHDLLFSRTFNLNPKGRPISLAPRVKLGYQQFDWFLNTFNAFSNFSIKRKSFHSERNDVFLSQKGFRVQPNIKLSIEKSHRLHYFISAGYNVQFNSKTGLLIKERDGFFLFRKKEFVENGSEDLIIYNNGDLLENKININAGILFQL